MSKNKKSIITTFTTKLQEKVKEEKKNNNKINNDVMKLINKELIIDYTTNQKVNAKLMLNKYLNVINYLMKENINLKKKIENIKVEYMQKNDMIDHYEKELKEKNEIIIKLKKNMSPDTLEECERTYEDNNYLMEHNDMTMDNIEKSKYILSIKGDTENNISNNKITPYNINHTPFNKKDEQINNEDNIFLNYQNNTFNNKYIQQNDQHYMKNVCMVSDNVKAKNTSSFNQIITPTISNDYKNYWSNKNINVEMNHEYIYNNNYNINTSNLSNNCKKNNSKENINFIKKDSQYLLYKNDNLPNDDKYIDELDNLINNTNSVHTMITSHLNKCDIQCNNKNEENIIIYDYSKETNILSSDGEQESDISKNCDTQDPKHNRNNDYTIKTTQIINNKINKNNNNNNVHNNIYNGMNKSKEHINKISFMEVDKCIINKKIDNDVKIITHEHDIIRDDKNYDTSSEQNFKLLEKSTENEEDDDNYEDLENIMSTILKLRKNA
ncbi:hypothetical protein PFAG_03827 [Plasmodium falciparum Santa Lucia]|uniref:Uncharacterized protein n=11 Tax=Plasmodium falciparum TaxID=5833 RepID=A0A024VXI8_PLAFA|nr:hypothetical protein PFFVO_05480 [Plasmodium falciparum Vietnam Oak-Knoll (FVO)]ETW30097.1 hypothetical protein PFFCH_02490 [Plasmodium falciparum FCH/4]ETW33038.1 hypothetical protein PFTANZ_06238 [Plasmodium falciparum Tanzania (2000708)]ETW41836.1 hypothetical protein PFNF135_03988 [Plasmodium falciparum NF135/5.C10]ETW48266.1 hypothetical protein PFMALIP_03730 [Plasmodium falciparum MaliPS096_E11]ETW60480.1 hypothetical protein PFMC_03760 [Plasmodium falciparum CAMP/Malaysia]EUR69330.1